MVQGLGIHLPMQGTQVQSLVKELRFHMPGSVAKKKKVFKKITQLSKQVSQQLPDFLKTKVAILMATLS